MNIISQDLLIFSREYKYTGFRRRKKYIPKPRKGWHLKGVCKPLFLVEEAIKKIGFAADRAVNASLYTR